MPIYEYECASCHHHFDLIQKVTAEPVKQCPKCFNNSVVKLVSAAGFQLKGTGWYATDFKDKPKSAALDKKDVSDTTTETSFAKEATPSEKTDKKASTNDVK